ncbi:MAG TPA: flagellar FlbD family protein [Acidimicrobiales bacterium]|nr:flagellar FlbD family protein [Acidimicrobiales bacterium]
MIPLTRLNGDPIAINPDRIERADVTPDVVLTMTDGSKYVIGETVDELIDRIRLFRASILALSHRLVLDDTDDGVSNLRLVRGGTTGTVVDRPEQAIQADSDA